MTKEFTRRAGAAMAALLVWINAPGGLSFTATAQAESLRAEWRQLPPLAQAPNRPVTNDWLITPPACRAGLFRTRQPGEVALDNGLIRRTFRLEPNGATVALDNLMTGASLLRAVKPEALLTVNGHSIKVGGLVGQPDHAYLTTNWLDQMRDDGTSLRLLSFTVGQTEKPFAWKHTRHCAPLPWPTPGMAVNFHYAGRTPQTAGLGVTVHYELYNGIPVLGKWLVVSNGTDRLLVLDRVTSEVLAAVEGESVVDVRPTNKWRLPPIDVMSDYSFGGMDPVTASRVTHWLPDPEYKTQVNYLRRTPCLLECKPPIGPGVWLKPGQTWQSWRTWLVIQNNNATRERRGLTVRHAERALAPWVTENPIMMHLTRSDSKSFRRAVDQCAAVGFELVIYSFGSGLNMEDTNAAYMARIKADVDYAHSKGIQVGAYSLFSSRHIDNADDVINPKTGKPDGAIFGSAPCLGSRWGLAYLRKLKRFITATGLDCLEHDGPYPGDLCASTNHPGHHGLEDSQWAQWKLSADFYSWCRARGIYVNAPDYYFFTGTSKTGMGYREDNWSLPRAQQIIHARQNIYDGTWLKTPTMGWMFVPLTQYHGGGAAATIEPLHEHLAAYGAQMANDFGAGVQACYRGPRLYDTPATEALVKRWVRWFKANRAILESDIIHVRRADGRDVDCILHVNPQLRTCGLAMVYNPLDHAVTRKIRLPLYYTGLTDWAQVRVKNGPTHRYKLARDYSIIVPVRVPAGGCTWIKLRKP